MYKDLIEEYVGYIVKSTKNALELEVLYEDIENIELLENQKDILRDLVENDKNNEYFQSENFAEFIFEQIEKQKVINKDNLMNDYEYSPYGLTNYISDNIGDIHIKELIKDLINE